ncbi:hypothetical protein AALC34_03325, partial [Staphylococcus capitis]
DLFHKFSKRTPELKLMHNQIYDLFYKFSKGTPELKLMHNQIYDLFHKSRFGKEKSLYKLLCNC